MMIYLKRTIPNFDVQTLSSSAAARTQKDATKEPASPLPPARRTCLWHQEAPKVWAMENRNLCESKAEMNIGSFRWKEYYIKNTPKRKEKHPGGAGYTKHFQTCSVRRQELIGMELGQPKGCMSIHHQFLLSAVFRCF